MLHGAWSGNHILPVVDHDVCFKGYLVDMWLPYRLHIVQFVLRSLSVKRGHQLGQVGQLLKLLGGNQGPVDAVASFQPLCGVVE